jgi:hypothetical protein
MCLSAIDGKPNEVGMPQASKCRVEPLTFYDREEVRREGSSRAGDPSKDDDELT